jgi:hypothetical protein
LSTAVLENDNSCPYHSKVAATQKVCPNLAAISTSTMRRRTSMVKKSNLMFPSTSKRATILKKPQDIKISEMMLEFKVRAPDDAFNERLDSSEEAFEQQTNSTKVTSGQITQHASAHQAAQYRTHTFSALSAMGRGKRRRHRQATLQVSSGV